MDAQSCVSRAMSLVVPSPCVRRGTCAELMHIHSYLLTCKKLLSTTVLDSSTCVHPACHTSTHVLHRHSPMYNLYQYTWTHKRETCLHVKRLHTNMCSVIHINIHMSHTEPCSHLQNLFTLTSTELCRDPLTPEIVQFNTCVNSSVQIMCTRVYLCEQCCAHQHTCTLCKAGHVHSHLGTLENTCAHRAMHASTHVYSILPELSWPQCPYEFLLVRS